MQGITEKRTGMLWGALLIIAGVIFLLQNFGFFIDIGAWLAMALFTAGGLGFLFVFLTDLRRRWWAAIPGATLLGLGATIFFDSYAPWPLAGFGGSVFLAAIGFGFILVFLADAAKWWALIPAGVMTTLAVVAGVDQMGVRAFDSGGIFFLGLGGTFLLVALLSGQQGHGQRWAWIPAAVLILMGIFIGTPWIGYANYLWPLALIAIGLFWVLRDLGGRSTRRDVSDDREPLLDDRQPGEERPADH
jgi:hypothetical protein